MRAAFALLKYYKIPFSQKYELSLVSFNSTMGFLTMLSKAAFPRRTCVLFSVARHVTNRAYVLLSGRVLHEHPVQKKVKRTCPAKTDL
jgi:hypothetical protein